MAQKTPDAGQVLNREFLEIRCRLIDIGAALDRIDRSPDAGAALDDPRYLQLRKALVLLATDSPDRAQQLQMVFSDDYDPNWRS